MAVKIYIDQGHNPTNPNAGAEGNGFREQDLVYRIGILTAQYLRAAGLDVRLSRPTAEITSASGSEAFVYSLGTTAQALAENILVQLNNSTGLQNRGVSARPTLYVLRRTAMPATLVELGFITNPYDAELMAYSPQLFAMGVANGVLAFLGML